MKTTTITTNPIVFLTMMVLLSFIGRDKGTKVLQKRSAWVAVCVGHYKLSGGSNKANWCSISLSDKETAQKYANRHNKGIDNDRDPKNCDAVVESCDYNQQTRKPDCIWCP